MYPIASLATLIYHTHVTCHVYKWLSLPAWFRSQLEDLVTPTSSRLAEPSLHFLHTTVITGAEKKKKSNCLVSWHCCLSMLAQAKRLGWNWLRRAAQVQGRALWRLLLPGGLRQPPKHTMQQSLCTDSKGVRYRLPPESRCPEIISSVSIHVVFGVIPLEQD